MAQKGQQVLLSPGIGGTGVTGEPTGRPVWLVCRMSVADEAGKLDHAACLEFCKPTGIRECRKVVSWPFL